MMQRAAIYARVSTPNQAQAQTIEQQLERLHEHVKEQQWELKEAHIFRDEGRSGANLKRPGLDSLRDSVKFAEVDCVLVTSPDRLARNYVHQMVLLDEWEGCGCEVIFLDRPMSDDPHDRLLLQIRGAVAEYERTLVSERMRRGRLAKYRAGTLLPWSKPPYGYRLDLEQPRNPAGVRIDESEAAVVRMIYSSYSQGELSLCGLAKVLQQQGIPTASGNVIWSVSSLRAILRQPAYLGKVYACRYRYREPKIRRSATHPLGQPHQSYEELPFEDWLYVADITAIIEQAQFDRVQTKLVKNKSFAKRNNHAHDYLLRALVSCGKCQLSSTARALNKGKYRYYVCAGKAKAIHSRKLEKCPSRFAPAVQLDELVWQDLCEVLKHPESISQAMERAHGGHWLPQELRARREHLEQALSNVDKQIARLTEAYLAEVIPLTEYKRRRAALEVKREGVETLQSQLTAQVDQSAHLSQAISSVEDFCQRVSQGLDTASFQQKRQLVELLIDRVIVNDEKVEIRYAIPLTPDSETIRFCHLRSDYRYHLYLYR